MNKKLISIIILCIFAVLAVITPFTDSETSNDIWYIFSTIVGIFILLWIILPFMFPENGITKLFKAQSQVMKILVIAVVIILLCILIAMQKLHIIGLIIFLIIAFLFVEWFFKKEE